MNRSSRPPSPHPLVRPNRLADIPEDKPIISQTISNGYLYNLILKLQEEVEELKKQIKN